MKKHCVFTITNSGCYIYYTIISEDMTSNGEICYGDGDEEIDTDEFIDEFKEYVKEKYGVTDFTSLYID